ncbi:MAG: T9SS type A sorting domain-containing protein, partial [Saprospiraceae bacterium]
MTAVAASMHSYPRPFSGMLNIEIKGIQSAHAQLTIINAMHQVVAEPYKGAAESDRLFQWQPSQAADGLYFLRLNTCDKVVTQAI